MARWSDPRLHIVLGVGVVILGYMFSQCWNYDGRGNYYLPGRQYPFCINFGDIVVLGMSFKLIVTMAICVILLSIYRLWSRIALGCTAPTTSFASVVRNPNSWCSPSTGFALVPRL